MGGDPGAMSSRWWKLFVFAGLGLWIGTTVVAGVTNDDPSDSTRVNRTFAIGGGIFFAAIVLVAAIKIRQLRYQTADGLYAGWQWSQCRVRRFARRPRG